MTTKIQSIRKEFGKPFRDVIRDYADEGYSCHRTAILLGMNDNTLRNYCTQFDLHKYWKPVSERRPECRGVGTEKKRKYTDNELLVFVRNYPTLKQFMASAPVAPGTIYYRFPGGWKEIVRQANERLSRHDSKETR